MRTFLALCLVVSPLLAHGVVATTSKTAPVGADTAFSFVGSMSGASAVAIGARDVLTAGHVGGGDFVLNGVAYRMASTVAGPTIGKNATDLRIVHLADTLPGWYDVATTIKSKAALTIVGYGGTGVVNDTGTGYALQGGGVRRAGVNVLSNKATVTGYGPTLRSLLGGAGKAVLVGGDSGGGWFVGGKLVGISSFTYTTDVKKAAYGFAKKAYFGSGAIDLTNKSIQAWLLASRTPAAARGLFHTQAVPEPGTMVVLALGAGALVRRRRHNG